MAKIIIDIEEDGNCKTTFIGEGTNNLSTIHFGMAFASATRVMANAIKNAAALPDGHTEQIEAQIAEVYNNDLQMGDAGEHNSTHQL